MPGENRFQLSGTQLIASGAATMTATVATSYFGVAGTLIGAGAVSVLTTVGATLYQHFLDRGKAQIAGRMSGRAVRRPWYVVVGAAAGVFLAVMGVVTAFEVATGRPLSNTVHGEAGRGTSVHPATTGVRPRPVPPERGPRSYAPETPSISPRRTPSATPSPADETAAPPPRSAEPSPDPIATRSAAPEPSAE
jgi:hypothetical protein